MASAFTHSFIALAGGKIFTAEKMPARFWALGVLCSVLPDFDIITFRLGIPYGHPFGHRGFFHSLLFAGIVAALVVTLAFRQVPRFKKQWWALTAYFFTITASHGVLDAMTTGGYGIGFFIPFDNTRYFLPWRPLVVSPIGMHGFFGRWGWEVIKSEFLWVWIPMLMILTTVTVYRKNHIRSNRPRSR